MAATARSLRPHDPEGIVLLSHALSTGLNTDAAGGASALTLDGRASVRSTAIHRRTAVFLALILLAALTGCSRPPAQTVTRVKLLVDVDGVYQVTAGELAAVGFDLGSGPADFTLSTGGEPVEFDLTGAGRSRVLRFYGQARGPEAYTATNVYWLAQGPPPAGDTPGRIIPRDEVPRADIAAAQVVTATLRVEEQHRHRGDAPEGEDRWTWANLFAPAELEIKLDVTAPAAGPALLSIYIIGDSQAPVDPDHHLTAALNGTPVADVTWDALGSHVITATVPTGVLQAGENVLRLAAPGDTGAPADALALDRVELAYPRTLTLTGDELTFGGTSAAYALQGKEPPALLWDITDPARPTALSRAPAADGRVAVSGDGTERRFIAVTEKGIRKPALVVPAATPNLPDFPGGADLLIVTVPQFHEALQPLIDAREAQGLRVALLDVTDVNDAFNEGRAGPEGIRSLVRHALATWTPPAPRFLLLAGDASYDPRGYLESTEKDLVPSQEVYTSFSGWTASDVWYAMPADDPAAKPRLAVGRLPAQTPEQMAVMVNKTLAYERTADGAAWRRQALLVADNDERGFADEAADFAGRLNGYTTDQVTLEGDGREARAGLLAALNEGTGLIGYFGHGSVVLWAQEQVFTSEDVAQLTNRDRPAIVFTVTCLSGFFSHPTTPSLGEALLRAPNGGAVAALVPSSAAVLGDQRLLAQNLADALAGDSAPARTLGETVLQAQAHLPEALGGVREILLTFNLLGDPALRLE